MSARPGRADGPAPQEVLDRRRPWLPAGLAAHGLTSSDTAGFTYVVVEEMVEGVVDLALSEWPAADGLGRLRFAVDTVTDLAVREERLHAEVYRGWLSRRPRVGDVLAGPVVREALRTSGGTWEGPLSGLLPGPVYDLSREARLVAKLALYAVRSDILATEEADAYGMTAKAIQHRRPLPVRERVGEPAPGAST